MKILTFLGRRLWWHLLALSASADDLHGQHKTESEACQDIAENRGFLVAPELLLNATVSWDEESSALPMTWPAHGSQRTY